VELSWTMKFRITAVMALGVLIIGIFARPLAGAVESTGVLLAGSITFPNKVLLLILAALTGLVGYFLAWPYGRQIAVLAVPSGIAFWAVRTENVAHLMMSNPQPAQRQALYQTLKYDPVLWLIIVAAGAVGVIIAQLIAPSKTTILQQKRQSGGAYRKPDIFILIFGAALGTLIRNKVLNPTRQPRQGKSDTQKSDGCGLKLFTKAAIALFVSIVIAQICISIFARDIEMSDSRLGQLVSQPSLGQIVFAVFVSFAIAAFLVKLLLGLGYIWPTVASVLVTASVTTFYVKEHSIQYLAQNCPMVFSLHAALWILPVQMVAFGSLGSIAGYWMAVRYQYWHEQELK